MTDAKENTKAAGGDAAKEAITDAKAASNDTAKAPKGKKYYKVLSNRIRGVWYKDPVPYVLLTEEEAKGFGKTYVEQKGHDKIPTPKKEEE